MTSSEAKRELHKYASTERKKSNEWFFKTKPGQYGHGDVFIGVSMPDLRKVAKQYTSLPLAEVAKLLSSKIHEERMLALVILSYQFAKSDSRGQSQIYHFYLSNTEHINNWDLVDVVVNKIVGAYLWEHAEAERDILYAYATSKNMWERRIAIVATSYFIYQNDFKDTLKIAEMLLHDEEELIHKAVGWMLREVGKRDRAVEGSFLKKHYKSMPRTMLRYSIEKFPERERQAFLKGLV